MRILLDANIPKQLKPSIAGHDVWTARERNLNKLPDTALLDAMGTDFDVLVTMDRSLPFQQRLDHRAFAVVVIRAKSNRIRDLLPVVPLLLRALPTVKPGEAREISVP